VCTTCNDISARVAKNVELWQVPGRCQMKRGQRSEVINNPPIPDSIPRLNLSPPDTCACALSMRITPGWEESIVLDDAVHNGGA
jgi:hypothetical protein